jgi:hypothetical protein
MRLDFTVGDFFPLHSDRLEKDYFAASLFFSGFSHSLLTP